MSTAHAANVFVRPWLASLLSSQYKSHVLSFRQRLVFYGCLAFIGVVSAWDAWLAHSNPKILEMEKNPICYALIQLEPNSKVFFFAAKAVSTGAVLVILVGLSQSGYRHIKWVTVALVMFQVGLLIHLYLSDSLCGGWPNFRLLFETSREDVFALRFQ